MMSCIALVVCLVHNHRISGSPPFIATVYIHKNVKNCHGGPGKPAIPGQCCFELVSSHQQGIHMAQCSWFMNMYTFHPGYVCFPGFPGYFVTIFPGNPGKYYVHVLHVVYKL